MARIRSIHPSLCSDEIYMSMTMQAKAAWPLLWMECDDHGIFEWKPIVLKARLFPADPVDLDAVLSELEALGAVKRAEIDGKQCGLVRNFCRYQRPKKPSYRFEVPNQFRTFVGLREDSGELVPNQFGTGGEKSVQMEEEGGRREKERKKEDAPNGAPKIYFFESGVIRLSERDFRKWQESFSNLDLRAELIGLTQWAGYQSQWFHAVSGALAKRNREVGLVLKARLGRPEAEKRVII